MGNYMPVGSRVKIGSDNRAFSVFYGIDSLPFSEGKPARLIPGRRIIGTYGGLDGLYIVIYFTGAVRNENTSCKGVGSL
jgi:hypothetical protein